MQSKTSFFNKAFFFNNLKKYWGFSAAYFLLLFLTLSYNLITGVSTRSYGYTFNDEYYQFTKTEAGYAVAQDIISSQSETIYFFTAVAAILTTVAVLFFIFNQRAAGTVHAFPVDRKRLFATSVVSVITLLIVPLIINGIVATIVLVISGVGAASTSIWMLNLMTFLVLVFAVGLSFFSAMITGQAVTATIIYGALNVLFVAAESVIRLLINYLCYGIDSYNTEKAVVALSPIFKAMSDCGFRRNYDAASVEEFLGSFAPQGVLYLVIIAIVGMLFTVAAFYMYKYRKIETTGSFIIYRWVEAVFFVICTFLGGITIAWAMVGIFTNDYTHIGGDSVYLVRSLIFGALGAVFVAFIIFMLQKRDFKVFTLNRTLKALVLAGCCDVLIMLLYFDVFGITGYVPEVNDVKAVTINASDCAVCTTHEDVEMAIKLHQAMVDNRNLVRASVDTEDIYNSINITYYLKNGKKVCRCYRVGASTVDSEAYAKLMKDLETSFNAPEFIKRHMLSEAYKDGVIKTVSVERDVYGIDGEPMSAEVSRNPAIRNVDEQGRKDIYKALLKDIDEGKIKYMSFMYDYNPSRIANSISYEIRLPEGYMSDNDRYYAIEEEISEEVIGGSSYYNPDTYSCFVNPRFTMDCRNTIDTLVETGAIEDSELITIEECGYTAEDIYY